MVLRERIWRSPEHSYIRRLPECLGVSNHGYTAALQRAMTDFGLDHSFACAAAKIKEHYGFEVPPSSLRKQVLKNAERLAKSSACECPNALPANGAERIIAEADGSMVPIVSFAGKSPDRRKNRRIDYREARLAACKADGSTRSFYAATMGSPETLGEAWNGLAKQAGRGLNSFVHVVCDGAAWLEKQAQAQLQPDRHLLDFYHVCEYLGAAKENCAQNARWLGTQKNRLKKNRHHQVIDELEKHLEPETDDDAEAPVRRAHRYLRNHAHQLDYQGSRQDGLPIGSGMIESGNKHLIQSRMKIAGAAWTKSTAEAMIAARAQRANGNWDAHWQN